LKRQSKQNAFVTFRHTVHDKNLPFIMTSTLLVLR